MAWLLSNNNRNAYISVILSNIMEDNILDRLRDRIYDYYDRILKGERPPRGIPFFPAFKMENGILQWSGAIDIEWFYGMDDETYPGVSYLLGNVVKVETLKGKEEDYLGITVSTNNGIEMFEHYSEKGFRPIVIISYQRGLIANITELEKRKKHPNLGGKSPEEIIRINFDTFPLLMDKFLSSSKREYQIFYLEQSSEKPLLY